jgi:hypothetical protein
MAQSFSTSSYATGNADGELARMVQRPADRLEETTRTPRST